MALTFRAIRFAVDVAGAALAFASRAFLFFSRASLTPGTLLDIPRLSFLAFTRRCACQASYNKNILSTYLQIDCATNTYGTSLRPVMQLSVPVYELLSGF